MTTRTYSFLLALLGVAFAATPSFAKGPPQLRTLGNQVLAGDKPISLRGVNVACMEWSSDGEGHMLETVRVAIKDWHANIIRLPMSQDRWFGKAPDQKGDSSSYRALIKKAVDFCAANNSYILLDLHWNDCGEWGQNIGQHVMPDMFSLDFWKSCAAMYKNNSAVLFDLYNEPHDTTWDIWMKGGDIEETSGVGARQGAFKPVNYHTPGMQAMLDTVRSTGAKNVVVCGGLDWAYDLSGFLKGYALKDGGGGRGVIYACHTYKFKGETIDQWLKHLDAALTKIPVIMSEFGDQNSGPKVNDPDEWLDRVVKEMDSRKCNWIAWDLHPAAGPTLISDWKYTPTPSFGAVVKRALLGG